MTDDTSNCIMIDCGSWLVKAGPQNEDYPKYIAPALVGYDSQIQSQNLISFYGNDVLNAQQQVNKIPLFERGKVKDWNKLESYFKNLVEEFLGMDFNEKAVMMNYSSVQNYFYREKMCQIFFESFNVPYFYMTPDSLLALYSSGKTSGIVIDSGHNKTSIIPISDGSIIHSAQMTSFFAGQKITQQLMKKYNIDFFEAQKLKEFLSHNVRKQQLGDSQQQIITEDKTVYKLPDGQQIQIQEQSELITMSPFEPTLIDYPSVGVQDLLYEVFQRVEFNIKNELIQSMIVCGGNTNFYDYNNNLVDKFSIYLSTSHKQKLINLADKINTVWYGGSLLTSLGTFQPMWVTRQEYNECGPTIVHRKSIQLNFMKIMASKKYQKLIMGNFINRKRHQSDHKILYLQKQFQRQSNSFQQITLQIKELKTDINQLKEDLKKNKALSVESQSILDIVNENMIYFNMEIKKRNKLKLDLEQINYNYEKCLDILEKKLSKIDNISSSQRKKKIQKTNKKSQTQFNDNCQGKTNKINSSSGQKKQLNLIEHKKTSKNSLEKQSSNKQIFQYIISSVQLRLKETKKNFQFNNKN